MGYTTDFYGAIKVEPPLSAAEVDYLTKFSESRRERRAEGPYFVDSNSQNSNSPADGQPGLWCQWIPTPNGIEWDGGEKFYGAADWMKYLIEQFIGSRPKARGQRYVPELPGHVCNGVIEARGEEGDDHWLLIVENNVVKIAQARPAQFGEAELV